jgi:hypothetical protein
MMEDMNKAAEGFGHLVEVGRVDARMRSDKEPYTDEQREALIREVQDYRTSHGSATKALSLSRLDLDIVEVAFRKACR